MNLFKCVLSSYLCFVPLEHKIQNLYNQALINTYVYFNSFRYDVKSEIIFSMIETESRYDRLAKSTKNAIGLLQILPTTAKDMKVDPHTISGNLEGGIKYFSIQVHRYNNIQLALAAYNSGPGNVNKYKRVPPFKETMNYVSRICGHCACG